MASGGGGYRPPPRLSGSMGYDEGGPLPPFSQYEPQVGQSRPVGSAHGSAAAETGRSGTRGSMRGSTRGSSRFSKPGSRGGSAFSKVAGFKQAGGSEDFTTYQGNLPAVFRNGGLELLRPGLAKESGYIECFPKASWKKPYLLEQLELFLEQKLRLSDRMVNGGALDRSFTEPMGEMKLANIKAIAANLHLDAHRQCFELFINAFSTYRPLLQRIKAQFDAALDDALKSEQHNIELRQQLVQAEITTLKAVEAARAEAAAAAAESKTELQRRLKLAEERIAKAEARTKSAQEEAQAAVDSMKVAVAEAKAAKEATKSLKAKMLAEASWSQRPNGEATQAILVNPRRGDGHPLVEGEEDGPEKEP